MNLFSGILAAHPSWAWAFPELVLIGAGILMICLDLLPAFRNKKDASFGLGVAALLIALMGVLWPVYPDRELVSGLLKNLLAMDGYALFFKAVILIGALAVFGLSRDCDAITDNRSEYFSLLIFATSALCMLAGAVDLLMVYLSLEFFGICSFVLIAFSRGDGKSQEGALKTLLLGAFSSAFLLYGFSLLYGVTGLHVDPANSKLNGWPLSMYRIGAVLQLVKNPQIVTLLLVFILVGVGFKIALAPFHMWTPEAYEGAPTPVTAYLATASKAAGIAMALRLFSTCFLFTAIKWPTLLCALAIISMTLGNVVAIWQTNIKRMLAYSSIAHMGYTMIGVVVVGVAGLGQANEMGRQGVAAVMIYSAVYLFMNLGAFAVVIAVSKAVGSDRIEDYAGLGKRAPVLAIAMSIFLLSLAGIPPTAGFVGKFFLFKAAIDAGSKAPMLYWLAIAAAVNSVISLFYYWNVVRHMYLSEPAEDAPAIPTGGLLGAITMAALAAVLVLGLFFGPLINLAEQARLIVEIL